MKATKIAFEKRHSDDSGVEKAVRYDITKERPIEFEMWGSSTAFFAEDIQWLIDALYEIKNELPEKPKA